MLYIYGDSHARFSFNNLRKNYWDFHHNSITMFRIGRDNMIINYNKYEIARRNDNVIVLAYGEVDCRCHIQRQINMGRKEDDVIEDLVNNYFNAIKNNILNKTTRIIVVGVIPPTRRNDYESLHGPILHEYPFVGTDEDRVRYTKKVNTRLEELSNETDHFFYFNPYTYYTRPEDGTLKHEFSDTNVHLGENAVFLQEFEEYYGYVTAPTTT